MKKPYRDWSHEDEDAPQGKGGAIMACMLMVALSIIGVIIWKNWDRIIDALP